MMKRLWYALAVTPLLACAVPAVAARAASEPFAVGGGVQLGMPFAFSSHGAGAAASGLLTRGGSQPFLATVTCLIVTGNDAIVTGVVTRGAAQVGPIVVAEAVDNGDPAQGASSDLLRYSGEPFIVPDPSDTTGRCYLPELPPVPIDTGNITVRSGD